MRFGVAHFTAEVLSLFRGPFEFSGPLPLACFFDIYTNIRLSFSLGLIDMYRRSPPLFLLRLLRPIAAVHIARPPPGLLLRTSSSPASSCRPCAAAAAEPLGATTASVERYGPTTGGGRRSSKTDACHRIPSVCTRNLPQNDAAIVALAIAQEQGCALPACRRTSAAAAA